MASQSIGPSKPLQSDLTFSIARVWMLALSRIEEYMCIYIHEVSYAQASYMICIISTLTGIRTAYLSSFSDYMVSCNLKQLALSVHDPELSHSYPMG